MKSLAPIFLLITFIFKSMSTATKLGSNSLHWIPAHDGYIPNDAIIVGVYNGKKLYFARGILNQGIYIGYIQEGQNFARIAEGNTGISSSLTHYQVLIGSLNDVNWLSVNNNSTFPKYAVRSGFESNKDPLIIGVAKEESNIFPGQLGIGWPGLKYPQGLVQKTSLNYDLLIFRDQKLFQDYLIYDSDLLIFRQNLLFASNDNEQNDRGKNDDQKKINAMTGVILFFAILIACMTSVIVLLACKLRKKRKMPNQSSEASFQQQAEQTASEIDLYPSSQKI